MDLLAIPILAVGMALVALTANVTDRFTSGEIDPLVALLFPVIQLGLGYYWILDRLAWMAIVADRKVGNFIYRKTVQFLLWRRGRG